jgi:hypothetical protein
MIPPTCVRSRKQAIAQNVPPVIADVARARGLIRCPVYAGPVRRYVQQYTIATARTGANALVPLRVPYNLRDDVAELVGLVEGAALDDRLLIVHRPVKCQAAHSPRSDIAGTP